MPAAYPLIPDRFPRLQAGVFVLREVELNDAPAWFAWAADPEVVLPTSADLMTGESAARQTIRHIRAAFRNKTMVRWAIAPPSGGPAIGTIGLFAFEWKDRRAEVGYVLDRASWGKGAMGASLAAVVSYAFETLDLHRLEATVLAGNERSVKVLEGAGFEREGLLRGYKKVRGEFRDFWMYSLLAPRGA